MTDFYKMLYGTDKPQRKPLPKTEWDALKKVHHGKCVICSKTEKAVGILEQAHLKAHSKGGSQIVPMCPTCHTKFDKGAFTAAQLKKIGLTGEQYRKLQPSKSKKKKEKGPFDL